MKNARNTLASIYLIDGRNSEAKYKSDSDIRQEKELSSEISQLKCQKAIINVCAKSEEAKIEVHLSNLDKHKNGYDILFNKEIAMSAVQREHLKQKEVEEKEIMRQKMVKILEKNEQQTKAAAAIEDECVAIERECNSLMNRNKAIMKRLRRKLIETEDMRRELTKNKFCHN
ncbi:unnamed protein product [Pieris brassicae]|uniref:Uncharacterized protein n=1 Tax=Pieris brassicae TaxID=7116 RepID=A0A9P0XAB0_PIEBR|nr:unnamed protein product [Pieris brassicae]